MYDPYSNHQIRFERTDRTGRYSPLHVEREPGYMPYMIGAAFAFVLAVMVLA